jgi:hypothetical protein
MVMVTVTDNEGLPSVRITWAAPSENGSTISAYEVRILSSTPDTYFESLEECDGSDSTMITNLYCDISMSTFIASPFGLSEGDAIVAIVRAENVVGWSTVYSDPNTGIDVTVQ